MRYVILTMSRGDSYRLTDWLNYHFSIGFNEFYILLDNPIDDSLTVINDFKKNNNVEVTVETILEDGLYFDDVSAEERWEMIKKWREENKDEIAKLGFPIVDPLSWRQYKYFPPILDYYASKKDSGWLSLIDVDEYIVIPGGENIDELTKSVNSPRIRFLNFNFNMNDWDTTESVKKYKFRWSRKDIISYGKGWDHRVKSIVKFEYLTPLVSVHSISRGEFKIIDYQVARLHHYKYPNQGIDIPYVIEDSYFDDFI